MDSDWLNRGHPIFLLKFNLSWKVPRSRLWFVGFPGWCLYQLSFFGRCGGWWRSCTRPQRRERRTRSPRRREAWQKCEGIVSLFIYFWPSVLWELLMIILHVFLPGKTRLTRCAGACRSQRKQGVNVHLLYYHVYKYMRRLLSIHVSLTDSNLCCPGPTVGRRWSCRSRPSRTTSKAEVPLKKHIWVNKECFMSTADAALSYKTYTQALNWCGLISVVNTISSHDISLQRFPALDLTIKS